MKQQIMLTYQNEQNELLKGILSPIFNYFLKTEKKDTDSFFDYEYNLELFITPECNQNCTYCYLVKNSNNLYPVEIRDKKKILNNLDILLQYYLKQSYSFLEIDLFSGEIWGSKFSFDIFNIILKYIKKGLKIHRILIPSNCSFVLNEKIFKEIQRYINIFENNGTLLIFSISNDGYYVDKINRPFYNEKITEFLKTEEYYNKLFQFAKDNNFGFHPMVSANSIELWKKNYQWWWTKNKEYKYNNIYKNIMFLEVRNDDWTDEKIIRYLDFLNFMIETDIKEFWIDKEDFTYLYYILSFSHYIISTQYEEEKKKISQRSYLPYFLSSNNTHKCNCSITKSLNIRLGDLAIFPCHRTSYDKFIYGYYKVENNEIVDIEAKNVNLAFNILAQENHSPKCNACWMYDHCIFGCYGTQYENSGDILYPCETVCNLQKAKTIFCFLKGEQIKERFKDKINLNLLSINEEKNSFIKNIINNTEEGKKWKKVFFMMN